jgi:hypothetical protein
LHRVEEAVRSIPGAVGLLLAAILCDLGKVAVTYIRFWVVQRIQGAPVALGEIDFFGHYIVTMEITNALVWTLPATALLVILIQAERKWPTTKFALRQAWRS